MSAMKTLLATGASSGIGFELVKQLLEQTQPYRIILGCRDTTATKTALGSVQYDSQKHSVFLFPLELSDLRTTRSFALNALKQLGSEPLSYLLLNAALAKGADGKGPHGSQWSEQYLVNHLSQHYLCHLLREKIVESHSRVAFVSSGGIRMVQETGSLRANVLADTTLDAFPLYGSTKFVQLLGALWWRRQLQGSATVVAVSPGLIPDTGLGRHAAPGQVPPIAMKDAKSIPEGAQSVLQALMRDDLPADPDQIFLTSWGEWWSTDVYKLALDKNLQNQFAPSMDTIETEEKLL